MSLINIEYGSLASSETLNRNFSYIDNKVDEAVTNLSTSISSLLSNIATINSRLGDLSSEIDTALETCVDNLSKALTEQEESIKNQVNSLALLPDWLQSSEISLLTSYTAESNGYLLLLPSSDSSGKLIINNVEIPMVEDSDNNEKKLVQLLSIPLAKGDIVTCTAMLAKAIFVPTVVLI